MRLFYCYSFPLKEFLVSRDEEYLTTSIHFKTRKKYWIFQGTDKLNQLLDEWRVRK